MRTVVINSCEKWFVLIRGIPSLESYDFGLTAYSVVMINLSTEEPDFWNCEYKSLVSEECMFYCNIFTLIKYASLLKYYLSEYLIIGMLSLVVSCP